MFVSEEKLDDIGAGMETSTRKSSGQLAVQNGL